LIGCSLYHACVVPPPPPNKSLKRGPKNDEAAATLIAHADRCWKAEEQNAARIAAKANLVLSAITAITGFKMYALGQELKVLRDGPRDLRFWLFWIALAFAMLFLVWALALVLESKGLWQRTSSISASASRGLRLPDHVANLPWKAPAYAISWRVFADLYRSFLDLQVRNEARAAAIDSSQRRLFLGVVLLFVSIAMYNWVSWSPSPIGREWPKATTR
jgi:hypothetical protein